MHRVPHRIRPSRARPAWRHFAAAVLSLALLLPASPATAERLGTDTVGEARLSQVSALRVPAPDIVAPAGILTTPEGRVLWARNEHERRAMASTTKIMTALVVLERARLSDPVAVPKAAEEVAQSPVNLTAGETHTVRQMLEVMLVESANDAAYSLAEKVGGSQAGFAALMNAEAEKLGLKDTHFTNPHGLDQPGHYTSAYDLAALSRYAMKDPEFRRIVKLRSVMVPGPRGERRVFRTTDELLGSYDGMQGIKTGFTDDAGYCLSSAAQRGGVELYGVILGTRSEKARFRQSARLLDWGFTHYRATEVVAKGVRVGTVPVRDWLDKDIVARVAEGTSAVVFDLAGPVTRKYALEPGVDAPVRAGQPIGTVSAYQGGKLLATMPVVAAGDMAAPGLWERVKIWSVRSWRAVFGPKELRAAVVTATN
jgi:D-alanyl-D-alanine carboxypeptidase (penicillin-binding protein 5/6)